MQKFFGGLKSGIRLKLMGKVLQVILESTLYSGLDYMDVSTSFQTSDIILLFLASFRLFVGKNGQNLMWYLYVFMF